MTEAIRLDGPPTESIDEIAAGNSAAMREMLDEPPIRALLTSDAPGFMAREIELTAGQLAMIEAAHGRQIIGDDVTGAMEILAPDAAVRFFAGQLADAISAAIKAGFVVQPTNLCSSLSSIAISATGRAV